MFTLHPLFALLTKDLKVSQEKDLTQQKPYDIVCI